MMRELLIEEGYPHVFCVSSSDAFDTVKREQIQIVLVDINILSPDEGWQLIAKLRLEPTTTTIPILICSTDPTIPKQKAEMLSRLNCHYVEKPFNLDTLLEMLATIGGA